jgi:dynein heavy chain
MIDWFHGWPYQALISVANRFLAEVELGSAEVRENVVRFMAHAHGSVKKVSDQYAAAEKRYNYVTPKSFLELISLYKGMLGKQRKLVLDGVERLESGLIKLQATTEDVEKLKESLKLQQIEVDRKKKAADELLERVGKETLIVQGEQGKAAVEEEKMAVQAREVAAKQADCAKDLEKAEPAIIAAEKALNTLNKGNLTELKSFGKPGPEIVMVMVAVMNLLSPGIKDVSWV